MTWPYEVKIMSTPRIWTDGQARLPLSHLLDRDLAQIGIVLVIAEHSIHQRIAHQYGLPVLTLRIPPLTITFIRSIDLRNKLSSSLKPCDPARPLTSRYSSDLINALLESFCIVDRVELDLVLFPSVFDFDCGGARGDEL